ncbi:MAG: nuclear transport factor 2 family protein [Actinomycetia bacterium]|nr:nuclear transport factor 2 family protein [Actinomycetes bacterium]
MTGDPAAGELARLLDERACERLINEYCQLVDHGDAPGIAELFTADGVWRSSEGLLMEGQDGIRAGFTRRQGVTRRQSRHLCMNVIIDVEGDDATGRCYLVNYRHDSETGEAEHPAPADIPKYVGEYLDRFVRTPDGWRLAERVFDMVFLRPSRR